MIKITMIRASDPLPADSGLKILRSVAELRNYVKARRLNGQSLSFVPTMGALHDGHICLVRAGLQAADICIASIFVNPAQFGPTEDYAAYPRTEEADLAALEKAGAQAVFYPSIAEIYPQGFQTKVSVRDITEPLEGRYRPGHFEGVSTVVCKLLLQVLPDRALFGEKDWQQLQVIKRMVIDLNIPVEIIGVPTQRDEFGLALSSRNAYLSAPQLEVARRLNRILKEIAAQVRARVAAPICEAAAREMILHAGFSSIDYVAVVRGYSLRSAEAGDAPDDLRVIAAVHLDGVRLIDNVAV